MEVIIFDWTGTLYERHRGLFDFTKAILDELKTKYKLGILSKSKNIEKRKNKIENSEISNYFSLIRVVNKKDEETLKKFMNKMGVKSSQTIIVGDRASRDIGPGNALGCKTIWVQKGDRSYDKPNEETGEPNHRIDSIKELPGIL